MSHCSEMRTKIESYSVVGGPSSEMAVAEASSIALGFGGPPQGPPAARPPREGSTTAQILCTQLAYILLLLEWDNPKISNQQAIDNYEANYDSCYPV